MRAKNLEPDRSLNCLTREIPKQKEFFWVSENRSIRTRRIIMIILKNTRARALGAGQHKRYRNEHG